jgi:hypothetical protein
MEQLPSTKTFVLGRSTVMLFLVPDFVLLVLLVETVPFKSDAVQKHTIITLIPMWILWYGIQYQDIKKGG